MFNEQIKMLKFYLDQVLNRFLPGIKGVGLIIILPACFVVIIYFFGNLNDTFTTLEDNKVVKLEKKYASLKKDLPIRAVVNYVTDQGNRGLIFYCRLCFCANPHNKRVKTTTGLSDRRLFRQNTNT
jgi:hypothetical protein